MFLAVESAITDLPPIGFSILLLLGTKYAVAFLKQTASPKQFKKILSSNFKIKKSDGLRFSLLAT
jgi:putative Mn2+ efflux pump MntP